MTMLSRPNFCTRTGILLLLIAICGAVDHEGRWNEDQYKSTGLHSYLYAIGKKICNGMGSESDASDSFGTLGR